MMVFRGFLIAVILWFMAVILVASCSNESYAKDLSKSKSVTPQRYCGFIVPKICIGSQSMHIYSTSVSAKQTRLKSLNEGMTLQNKPAMANMQGGTVSPRVNPLTSLITGENLKNSKLTGGNHA